MGKRSGVFQKYSGRVRSRGLDGARVIEPRSDTSSPFQKFGLSEQPIARKCVLQPSEAATRCFATCANDHGQVTDSIRCGVSADHNQPSFRLGLLSHIRASSIEAAHRRKSRIAAGRRDQDTGCRAASASNWFRSCGKRLAFYPGNGRLGDPANADVLAQPFQRRQRGHRRRTDGAQGSSYASQYVGVLIGSLGGFDQRGHCRRCLLPEFRDGVH